MTDTEKQTINETDVKAADVVKEEAPKTKGLRAIFYTGENVNHNEFKTFLKSCPFSFEGGQTIEWGRDEKGQYAFITVQVPVETVQDEFDAWLVTSGVPEWYICSMPTEGAPGYFLAPEPPPAEPEPVEKGEDDKAE